MENIRYNITTTLNKKAENKDLDRVLSQLSLKVDIDNFNSAVSNLKVDFSEDF
jgi:hypothetical protein